MTTHHNCKHPDRSRSNYARRLAARGLSKSPRLEELDTLAKRQDRRVIDTCSVNHGVPVHNVIDCDGQPWFTSADTEGENQ